MDYPEKYLRFPLLRRLEHWLTVTAFTILALTGLPQKFITLGISETAIRVMGGIEFIRVIHRIAAVTLMLIAVYHLGVGLYGWFVKRKPLSMFPSMDDIRAVWGSLKYNLKMSNARPQQGFYTFEEKFEYWALVWGSLIMIVTGFFLWNPITAARFLPGEWIPAAKAAHGNEALLAVLAILLWHTYHVLIKHFNRSMYNGYLSRHEMEEFHPLALEPEISSAQIDAAFLKRKKQFSIGYGFASFIFLVGIYWFISTETTALDSPAPIPDTEGISVYSPIDPTPFPSAYFLNIPPAPIGDSWSGGIGSFLLSRCGVCHNPINQQGALVITSYADLLNGGNSGPAIIPGASGVSLIIIWQSRGEHPSQLSNSEIVALRNWIDANAPEN